MLFDSCTSLQHCLAQPQIRRGDGPLALVLAPTRELAQQIEKEVRKYFLYRTIILYFCISLWEVCIISVSHVLGWVQYLYALRLIP